MTLTVGSLFAGIGGFDLGFERAGMRTEWFVEQDPYCQAVLKKHWPGVPVFDDVRTVGAHNLTPVDVLCGGFPCQDISAAGRGAGLSGARSGLWAEFARLIGDLRPSWVVVENVPVLRSRGLGRILGEMAELGYDAEWNVISAADAGAPHLRKRIWIVAYPQREQLREQSGRRCGTGWAGEALAAVDGEAQLVADPEVGRVGAGLRAADARVGQHAGLVTADGGSARGAEALADADGERLEGADARPRPGGLAEPSGAGWWATEPDVGRVAHGVPARVDRLRALGNALVPQIAEEIGRRIVAYEEAA